MNISRLHRKLMPLAGWFALNPLWTMGWRTRLRMGHLISWGIIGLCVTAFVFSMAYLTTLRRGQVDPVVSAKAAMAPLIILQGIILMGMGTAAVASGIARERQQGLVDYHRITPMSPGSKILGYLFGLPLREYLLFAITIPFAAYAAIVGEIAIGKLVPFYAVFFSSVWLYHMTGLVAGMVSTRPWQSTMLAVSLVFILYFVLPQVAALGLSFFDFLTVRPTFYSMVVEEIETASPRWRTQFMEWRYKDVPFFAMRFGPVVFSLLLQACVLVTLFVVVHRRWLDERARLFSKPFGLLFGFGAHVFILGSLWPQLRDETLLQRLALRWTMTGELMVSAMLVGLYAAASAAVLLLTLTLITPDSFTALSGLRRALKLDRLRAPFWADAAPGWPWMVLLLLVAWAGYGLYVRIVPAAAMPPGSVPWLTLLAPMLLVTSLVVFYQAMVERIGYRPLTVVLFLLWVAPVMAAAVLVAAFDRLIAATYVAASCPLVSGYLAVARIVRDASPHQGVELVTPDLWPHLARLIWGPTLIYGIIGLAAQVELHLWRKRRWRREVDAALDALDGKK